MESVQFTAQTREPNGKKGTKQLRAQGLVPGVLYGGSEVKHIAFTPKAIKELVYTAAFKTATIDINGTQEKCILKDIIFHPVTDEITHVDFLRLIEGHPIKVELPVKFTGVSPGVKLGGKMIQSLRRIKVKCLPENLVDTLEVDISHLDLGDSVRVKEIKAIDGLEVMVEGATPVGLVEIPRALRSAEAAEGEEGEGAEAEATEEAAAE